jgi:hypothetical protein
MIKIPFGHDSLIIESSYIQSCFLSLPERDWFLHLLAALQDRNGVRQGGGYIIWPTRKSSHRFQKNLPPNQLILTQNKDGSLFLLLIWFI